MVKKDFKVKKLLMPKFLERFKRLETKFDTTITGSSLNKSPPPPTSFAPEAAVALARS